MIEVKNATINGEQLGYDNESWIADFQIRASDGEVYRFYMHELDFSEFVMKVMALQRSIQDGARKAGLGPPITLTNTDDAHAHLADPACIAIEIYPAVGPVTGYFLDVDTAEKVSRQIQDALPSARARLAKLAN